MPYPFEDEENYSYDDEDEDEFSYDEQDDEDFAEWFEEMVLDWNQESEEE